MQSFSGARNSRALGCATLSLIEKVGIIRARLFRLHIVVGKSFRTQLALWLFVLAAQAMVLAPAMAAQENAAQQPAGSPAKPIVIQELFHDTSIPLRDMPPIPPRQGEFEAEPARIPHPERMRLAPLRPDVALQTAVVPSVPFTSGLNFNGVGNGFSGPSGTFTVNSAPPDTNGAVGSTQYVQIVNSAFAVFNKSTGAAVFGPVATQTLWSGFGGLCQSNNDGDGVVVYDKLANRWVIAQFAVTGAPPFLQCVAVSTTSDATGSFNRYAFQYSNFDDYPKMGVWPDGYYTTFNMFNAAGTMFLGPQACAFDRSKMLTGAAATQVCFQLSPSLDPILPADVDGTTPPPANAPNYLVGFNSTTNNSLDFFKFHVDFVTPGNSTLTGPTSIPVTAFSPACGGGTCIPQSGTPNQLDSLADRVMFRLGYRNFGNYESLVVNHSVTAGSTVGVRWYQIWNPGGTPLVYQQGTFSPDATFRWMGSTAMDHVGNMAVGYSTSSSTLHPGLAFTDRAPDDASGTMAAENTLFTGAGSQTGTLHRWGDYSAMTVDPVDDCTFWYTTEYIPANGSFNWRTRIASFKLNTCNPSPTATTTNLVSSSNPSVSGSSVTFTATISPSPSNNGFVEFFADGSSMGASVAVSGGTASITTSSLTTGSHNIVAGYSGSGTAGFLGSMSNTVVQVVNASGTSTTTSLSSSVNPSALGQSVSFTATVSPSPGSNGTVQFKDNGVNLGAPVALSGGVATLTTSALTVGTHPMTAVYNGAGGFNGSTSGTLVQTVVAPPTISKAFGAASIPLNGTTSLSFTINNPNAGTSLTGVGFSDTLPGGLVVASPNGLTGSCGGGTITATAGSGSISLSGATLAASGSCTFSVNITGTTVGTKSNTTGNVTSTESGAGGTASASVNVDGPPTLSKVFNPATIALNGTSLLTFTVTNPAANPDALTGVAFTDTLPVGLTVANGTFSNCSGGTVTTTAPRTIALSGGTLAVNSQCTFGITVTGTVVGSYNNVTGSVTSANGGTGGTASATLKVDGPPTVSKAFGAASVPLGGTTSLTFTLANPGANPDTLTGVAFSDTLPAGLVVATPNGLTGSCLTVAGPVTNAGSVTAVAGGTSISLSALALTSGGTCTFTVNVMGTTAGAKSNTTGAVTSTQGGTGVASNTANLTVIAPPSITKTFGAATVALNAGVSLTFTITNPNSSTTLNGIGFTDNLPAGLSANVVSFSNTCGASFSGTNATTIVISGGTLAAGASCTVSGTVSGTVAGVQNNSVTINSTNGGTGNTSTTSVTVVAPPTISKAFGAAQMSDVGTTSLTFTITNPNTSTALSGVGFTDSPITNFLVSNPNGLTGSCGAGTITANPNSSSISLSGGTIAANASCTFSVNITGVNPGFSGTISNTTSKVTSTEGGTGATSNTASILLLVPPSISKAFGAASVPLNGTTSLTFTLSNGNPSTGFTGVGFTDNLPAGLVVATPNGFSTTCSGGTATAVAGSGSVSLSGATLAGSASCTLTVNVTGTTAGAKNNVTTAVTSNEAGTGNTAAASLAVAAPPSISKVFGGVTVPLGGSTSLAFTITNPAANSIPLTGVAFTDTLPAGLTVPNSSASVCGGMVTLTAPSTIALSGASIAVNNLCNFSVTVTGTTTGLKNNTTGHVTSTEGGTGNTASASTTVVAPPTISKSFGAPRIAVTGTASLSFTTTNPNTGTTLTGVGFSDTLPAGLIINTPNGLSGTCGGGAITATQGTSVISLSGASLAASASCTFSVNVLGTAGGDQNNATGNVTSTEGGTGGIATATINVIAPPTLSLLFNPNSIAVGTTTLLQFTITNPAVNTTDLNGVAFTDTLPAGLTVTSNGGVSQCGGTLTTTNPTTIHLAGATVSTSSPCVFTVTVTGAAGGNYSNIVSGAGAITSTTSGIGATGPASNTAPLTVVSPPNITKTFGALTIPKNGTTTLTFSISNPNIGATLNGIAFTDNLPSGLLAANPPNLSNTCGGTATGAAGASTITLAGGTLAASASCTFKVDVVGITAGVKNNSVQVTSTEGGTGNTSSTSVTVVFPPSLSKAFGAASIPLNVNAATTLTFTLASINATTTLTGIAFSDNLPAGLIVATPNGLASNCGGTATATAGSGSVSLSGGTLAPSNSCSIVVNVTGTAVGTLNNVTGNVSSTEGGTGGVALASINVNGPPTVAKAFGAVAVPLNGTTSLTFTLTNPAANPDPLTGIAFTDSLQSGLVVATPNGLTGSCLTVAGAVTNAGSVTAVAGSTSISISALALTSNGTCTFTVNVTGTQLGANIPNTTSAVTSTNGGTGVASNTATLSVAGPPNITKTFGALTIPKNGTTTLTFNISNPNSTMTLNGIAFTDTLPSGLLAANPPNLSNTCGGTATGAAGASTITLSGGTLAPSTSCAFKVDVVGLSAGLKNNSVQVTSTEGGTGNTSNASITVVFPPSITKAFGAGSIPVNGTTSLTFTLASVNASTTLTGIAFSDTLPAGLVVATPNGLVGNCGGTVTATAGSGSVSLSGGTLAPSNSCNFSVNVTGTTAGTKDNTTGNVTSNEGGTGGVALASLTVIGADVAVTLTHHPDPAAIGGRLVFVATVTNNGPQSANVTFSESFVGAQYLVSATSTQGTCGNTEPVTCNLGTINSSSSATVTIVVTPLLGRNVTATATVTPDVSDPDLTNNTASDTGRIRFKPQRF